MADITYDKVRKYIEKYHMIEANDLVVAGISGGADSVCLLHILWRLQKEKNFRLLAVHVDHGVRAESAEDAAYVEQLCSVLKVPFYLRKIDMNRYAEEHRLSPEEAGRVLRYEAFREVLDVRKQAGESPKTAVAHNCNDRAETMLFHMFRGSGMKGLASIQPVRGSVIRPLLCLERAEIERYLAEHDLRYCQDNTNEEDTYTRNRIRHHILPYAEQEICSGTVAHMGGLAEILSETERYLEKQTRRLYGLYVEEAGTDGCKTSDSLPEPEHAADNVPAGLHIKGAGLLAEDSVMYKRVLLACMERLTPHRKDITGQHIEALVQLMGKDGSKEISLPYGIRAYKEYDHLYLIRTVVPAESGNAETDKAKSGKKISAVSTLNITNTENTINIISTTDNTTGNAANSADYVCEDSRPAYKVEMPSEIFVPGEGVFTFSLLEKESVLFEKEVTDYPDRQSSRADRGQGPCLKVSGSPRNGLGYPDTHNSEAAAEQLQKEENIPQNRYTKWFDYDKITTSLILRTRQKGDYLTIDAAMHTKSVKQYMINEKIPKMQRDRMHLLADGEHILWIPGYRISQKYKVDESTERILQVQFRGGSDGGTN